MSTNLPTLTLRDESKTPSCAQKQILPSPKVAWQGRALFAVKVSLWNSPSALFFVSACRFLKSAYRNGYATPIATSRLREITPCVQPSILIPVPFLSLYSRWCILYILAPGYTKGNHGNVAYENAMERLRTDRIWPASGGKALLWLKSGLRSFEAFIHQPCN